MSLRRVVSHGRARRWRRTLEEFPLWGVALGVALLFSVISSLQPMPLALELGQRWLGLYPVAMFLMAVRDAGLLAFFAFGARARRVESATLLYIVMLSIILPALFTLVGLEVVSRLLVPFKLGGWQATLVMGVQAAFVWALALLRARKN
jgi:hypothetical protein